jgi:hypothetical protein
VISAERPRANASHRATLAHARVAPQREMVRGLTEAFGVAHSILFDTACTFLGEFLTTHERQRKSQYYF